MPPRKELCRNFQSGSCRYGATCRFYHPQQQSRFGFQTGPQVSRPDQTQQMPNPFGFGVQINTQPSGGDAFGPKQPPFKPFANTWSRPSSTNNGGSTAKHDACTDSESCKRVMVDDLEKESPLWKLTCYAHRNCGPCDVGGDTSFEELRALAYDDAKQGKSVQFIIERERNMVNSKLVEFRNLLQKPNTASPNAGFITQSPFVGVSPNAFGNSGPSATASSFSQLNTSLNSGSAVATNYMFGQPNAFKMPSSIPQTNASPFNGGGPSGFFGGQISQQPAQSPFSFGTTSNRATNTIKNPFSTPTLSQRENAADNQLFSNVSLSASSAIEQSSVSTQLIKLSSEDNAVDENIWTADWKWNCGEIPEQPPPDIYIH